MGSTSELIYYFLILCLGGASLFVGLTPRDQPGRDKLYAAMVVAALAGLVLVGGLRKNVGTDWDSYQILFAQFSSWRSVWEAREEVLFCSLMYVSRLIFDNFYFCIFVIFALTFILKAKIIIRLSPDVFLSLCVYCYTLFMIYDLNGLRQGLAMAFLFLAIPFVLARKLKLFLVFVFLASLCHLTAVVFLPFYFIGRINLDNRKMILVFLAAMLLAWQVSHVIQYNSYVQAFLALEQFSHYNYYVSGEDVVVGSQIFSPAFFQRVIILLLFMVYFGKIKAKLEFKLLLRNAYIVSILLFILFNFSADLSTRLSFYFKSMEIFMVPMVATSPESKQERLLLTLFFILLCLVGVNRLLAIPHGQLVPYHNLITN